MQKSAIAAIVLAAALATLTGCNQQDTTANVQSAVGAPLPTHEIRFTFPDLAGKPHQFSEWQGQVVVLNFWAPWCPPCRREMPALVELHKKYAGRLSVIGISVDDRDSSRQFVEREAIDFPILLGEDRGILLARELGNRVGALPYTVVINRQGRVTYTHGGAISLEQAEAALAPLL